MTSKGPKSSEQRGGGGGGKSQARRYTGSSGPQQASSPTTWDKLPKLTTGLTSGQLEQWKRDAIDILAKDYGDLALSLETGEAPAMKVKGFLSFTEDAVSAFKAEYIRDKFLAQEGHPETDSKGTVNASAEQEPKKDVPDEVVASFQRIASTMYEKYMEEEARRIAAMNKQCVQLFSAIWLKLSRDSQERVQLHKSYGEKIRSRSNPLALWNAVCDTHKTFNTGDQMYDLMEARRAFSAVSQGTMQSLAQYKAEFDAAFEEVRSRVGEDDYLPSDQELAYQFFQGLDETRFGTMTMDFRNRVTTGQKIPWPKNLVDA